jgi:hypothetical protein
LVTSLRLFHIPLSRFLLYLRLLLHHVVVLSYFVKSSLMAEVGKATSKRNGVTR